MKVSISDPGNPGIPRFFSINGSIKNKKSENNEVKSNYENDKVNNRKNIGNPGIIDFITKWFMGPFGNLKELMLREVGYCSDMKRGVFRREVYSVDKLYLESNKIRTKNLFFGVGFWLMSDSYEPDQNYMFYDRVVFDFDSKDDPSSALKAALSFMNIVSNKHHVDVIVFKSGFKGAHVVITLSKPTNWRGYSLLWDYFYSLIPQEHRVYVDVNMKQWNRLSRVPLTYNVRDGEKRLVEIIHPSIDPPFEWSKLRKLDPSSVTISVIPQPKTIKLSKLRKGEKTITAPCMVKLFNDAANGVELSHNARLALASYMLCKGFSIEEVINVFSKQPDFSEKITRYQVEYIARRKLKPYNCDKMSKLCLCVNDCGVKNPLNVNR